MPCIVLVVTIIIAFIIIGGFVFLNKNKKLGLKLASFIEVNYDNLKIAVNGFTSGIGVISFVYVLNGSLHYNNDFNQELTPHQIKLFYLTML